MGLVKVQRRDLRTGRMVWDREGENLEVYGGATCKAYCLAGQSTYAPIAVGFGSGVVAAALGDTELTSPVYVKPLSGTVINDASDGVAVTAASNGPASVKYTWSINAGSIRDYALTGMTITEVGLFANPSSIVLPARTGTTYPSWQSDHYYSIGDTITDSNGNIQAATVAGTSHSSTHPTWSTTVFATTIDNSSVTWTCVAKASVTGLVLVARKRFTIGLIGSDVGFTSTWTIIIPPGVV
jgi:hypothetical protein